MDVEFAIILCKRECVNSRIVTTSMNIMETMQIILWFSSLNFYIELCIDLNKYSNKSIIKKLKYIITSL